MAKKNSIDFQVALSVPSFIKLEGVILEVTSSGVLFDSRKPGGQNRIQEFVGFDNLLAVIGNVGKEGGVLVKRENTVVFGNKQRNALTISNPVGIGTHHQKGSNDTNEVVIVDTSVAFLKNEIKSEEGGRGRKKGSGKKEKAAPAGKKTKGKKIKGKDWE